MRLSASLFDFVPYPIIAMTTFPAVDPIPLPAPVWLFKGLHVLTLSLHFVAVEVLIGGLLAAIFLNLAGVLRRGTPGSELQLGASAALARRMPIVMTYVINLGVPPLLFSQVLYGRALYTSSVLIGVYWISVIFLLMACYWLLYRFAKGTEQGRAVWWIGGLAWLLAGGIARIYTMNMTLMLRPEVWRSMYEASSVGLHLPPHDPTELPRWLFMMAGGVWVAGLWMVWISSRKSIEAALARHLSGLGGRLAVIGIVAQGAVGVMLLGSLAPSLREALGSNAVYADCRLAWTVLAAGVLLFGAWAAVARPRSSVAAYGSALLVVLTIAAWTLFRDGLRDLTLAAKGFNVWDRVVVTNWSVVAVFFVVFVAGLGALAWLVSVMARAKTQSEGSLP